MGLQFLCFNPFFIDSKKKSLSLEQYEVDFIKLNDSAMLQAVCFSLCQW